jgi:hypothetical protein
VAAGSAAAVADGVAATSAGESLSDEGEQAAMRAAKNNGDARRCMLDTDFPPAFFVQRYSTLGFQRAGVGT